MNAIAITREVFPVCWGADEFQVGNVANMVVCLLNFFYFEIVKISVNLLKFAGKITERSNIVVILTFPLFLLFINIVFVKTASSSTIYFRGESVKRAENIFDRVPGMFE